MPYEANCPDNLHRLNMGMFPKGARIALNPYNKIPGFSCTGPEGADVHFVPGFPVMAWPMIEWVLDQQYPHFFNRAPQTEQSVIVFGALEAVLTPLMERIEQRHPQIRVFSLLSVDHPQYGRYIELGVRRACCTCSCRLGRLARRSAQYWCKLRPSVGAKFVDDRPGGWFVPFGDVACGVSRPSVLRACARRPTAWQQTAFQSVYFLTSALPRRT